MLEDILSTVLPGLGLVLAFLALALVWARRRQRRQDALGIPRVRTFRTARLAYNLTAERRLVGATLLARGTRMTLLDRVTVETGRGDPALALLASATASKTDVELRISRERIQLTVKGEERRFPRSALVHVFCATGLKSRRTIGYGSWLIYVCLHLEGSAGESIGDAAVAVFTFTRGAFALTGSRNPHPYAEAFERAERLARELSDALEVPYHANDYRGIFSPLAVFLR